MTGTIIIDPPWPYQKAKKPAKEKEYQINGYSNFEYPPLSLEELARLPIIELGDYLFLWTTGPFIEDAYKLIRAWGFEPITFLAWVKTSNLQEIKQPYGDSDHIFKPSYGVGYWFRGCVEPIILAKKPKAPSIRTAWTGLLCDNAGHSRKPDSIHDFIEKGETPFPKPLTELFARRTRDGWATLGSDLDGLDIRESIDKHLTSKLAA